MTSCYGIIIEILKSLFLDRQNTRRSWIEIETSVMKIGRENDYMDRMRYNKQEIKYFKYLDSRIQSNGIVQEEITKKKN
mgnify:CR=1 FL=1